MLTQDPIGLAGGVNLYEYAGSNPVSFDDPYGLCPGPVLIVCVRVAIAAMAAYPAVYRAAAEASTGLSSRSGRLTGSALRSAGIAGERAVEARLVQGGATILGKQVSANTSAGRRVMDFLVQKPDGSMVAIEAKSGAATRTAQQLLKDTRMAEEGATLGGKNAPDALRGKPVVIPTEVMHP